MSDQSRAKKLYRYRRKTKINSPDSEIETYLSGKKVADKYVGYSCGKQSYFVLPYTKRLPHYNGAYDWTEDKLFFYSKEEAERFCKYLGKKLEEE